MRRKRSTSLLRCLRRAAGPPGSVFNVGARKRTSLDQLFTTICDAIVAMGYEYYREPEHADFPLGDIRHSLADIGKARNVLGFSPEIDLATGLELSIPHYG
ncbi:Rossmann-fold NAD(P)-binding domain-containing protein [Sphingomicrobium lutaoense]|uniref:Nucleoside-diphosphate-sugar epimerase n=1 Tax=Sphingomicrobium lutaoense TaxID=515949 RepID=A0A839Z1F2_9SPHN|nr:hypothetical protein [Sphingomicrobium lutaoense]MBB3763502.1 nucleoside-diphosphate-sugar epimerase [Sphingomicrobium lutaoense]